VRQPLPGAIVVTTLPGWRRTMRNDQHSPRTSSKRMPQVVVRHELSEHLGWTAKLLISQPRPTLGLRLAELCGLAPKVRF
jgi:hypothetical protein